MSSQSKAVELFDRKKLLKLIVPVAIEQTLLVTVGMADMIMVSRAGEAAVSGISLVNSICILIIIAFNALSSGGSIVVAQYIGQKNRDNACLAATQTVILCASIASILAAISLIFNSQILSLVYGSVDADVMDNAIRYFRITAFSFPFLAIYNASAASFRVMNRAKISMMMSFIMNGINVSLNAILIFGFNMEVEGVAYATLVSRVVAGSIILFLLTNPNNYVYISAKIASSKAMIQKLLKIGVPQALESSMFQFGKLCTQSLISSFGTAAIAANACASTVETLSNIPGMALTVALLTIVGQCVGAGEYGQARKNTLRLLKYTYIFLFVLNVTLLILSPTIISWYNLTDTGSKIAQDIIIYHNICCMLIWPLSFSVPSTLKAAGDVQYTLKVSVISMWVFRVGCAYLITSLFNIGALGVWIAMTIDWAFRSICYVIRFKGKKWETKAIVKTAKA